MITSVMVKAIKRGTVVTAHGNFHFDPEGVDEARQRAVPIAAAHAAKDKGLVEILKTRVVSESEGDLSVDEAAAARTKRQSRRLPARDRELADALGASGVNDTIASTHTETDRTLTVNTAEGVVDVEEDDDDSDDDGSDDSDAPPAGDDDAGDDEGANSGSSRVRRAAARRAAGAGKGCGRKPAAATE